jgi:hypothetical protein
MAIEFNLSALPKRLLTGKAEYAVTDQMIWRLAFTGMANPSREFSAADVPEFYARDHLLCALHGDKPFSLEQIRARVGMKVWVTNVGLQHLNRESRAHWLKRVCSGRLDEWAAAANKPPAEPPAPAAEPVAANA